MTPQDQRTLRRAAEVGFVCGTGLVLVAFLVLMLAIAVLGGWQALGMSIGYVFYAAAGIVIFGSMGALIGSAVAAFRR